MYEGDNCNCGTCPIHRSQTGRPVTGWEGGKSVIERLPLAGGPLNVALGKNADYAKVRSGIYKAAKKYGVDVAVNKLGSIVQVFRVFGAR